MQTGQALPACSVSVSQRATLQGEPISARIRGTEILSPWYPPGDKIWRRTAHSPQSGSHTLSAKFPCMCPDRTRMSSGRDFFDNLIFCLFFRARSAGLRLPHLHFLPVDIAVKIVGKERRKADHHRNIPDVGSA